jgi:hypothetical protein
MNGTVQLSDKDFYDPKIIPQKRSNTISNMYNSNAITDELIVDTAAPTTVGSLVEYTNAVPNNNSNNHDGNLLYFPTKTTGPVIVGSQNKRNGGNADNDKGNKSSIGPYLVLHIGPQKTATTCTCV